jgi:acetyl-CoA synthetase (ADP-forming)
MTSSREIIQTAIREGRKALLEHEARELARSVGIIVPKFEVVGPNDEQGLLGAAERLGYPLAVKALSPDILHKTEAGAIMLDIKNRTTLVTAVKQIKNTISQRSPDAKVLYFLIEKMMPAGPELLIGGLRDEQFGPAIAFGLGGIWTETLKDAVFGILPLSRGEMIEMIDGTRAGLLFKAFRGDQPLDREPVLSVMQAVAGLLTEYQEISEIDLNPVRVYARGAAALHVRILLRT